MGVGDLRQAKLGHGITIPPGHVESMTVTSSHRMAENAVIIGIWPPHRRVRFKRLIVSAGGDG
jgi:hypothetical protein